jgi:hypothetical protein
MASTISAGTTSGTALNMAADTSGNLAFTTQAGANTITVPNATGTMMVSGNMPAFSAYNNANQTVSTGVSTKLQLNTELFDTANAFDSTTNYRFTPQVAGYYQFNGQIYGVASISMAALYTLLFKNGSLYQYGSLQNITVGASGQSQTINTLVFLNGTTDYVEFYGTIIGSGTCTFLNSGSTLNWFNGVLVRAA